MCEAGASSIEEGKMSDLIKELESLHYTEHDAGEVFSGRKYKRKLCGFASPCSFTPDLNPAYLFHHSSRDAVVWFMDSSDPLTIC